MNKTTQIYLAGKMGGLTFSEMNEWRNSLVVRLNYYAIRCGTKIDVINPVNYYNFESPRHQNEFEIMQFDLNRVKTSDLIIVKLDNLNSSIGTAIELYEAYKRDIPVIGYGTMEEYKIVHPWLKLCISRIENTIESVCEYVTDFYFC